MLPHRHRLGALAAIKSGRLKDSNCSMSTESMKPDPARAVQANNVVAASPNAISRAVELLRQGHVIGLPTETVYGLAGDGLNPAALARIFEVKQRPLFDPLILHFADAAGAFALAEQVTMDARELARRFWPGPLTIVLRKIADVPDLATSGCPTWRCACQPILWRRHSCAPSVGRSLLRAQTASAASARPTRGRSTRNLGKASR